MSEAIRQWLGGLAGAGVDEMKDLLERLEEVGGEEERSDAEVWTAVELSPEEQAALSQRLQSEFGEDLEIDYHVEPAVIGGVVVRVGDRYLDASVAAKLGQLRQELVTGRVA